MREIFPYCTTQIYTAQSPFCGFTGLGNDSFDNGSAKRDIRTVCEDAVDLSEAGDLPGALKKLTAAICKGWATQL